MEFEWDENKNLENQRKHGISFDEAAEIFRYPMYEIVDTRTDYGETRYIGIDRNRYLVMMTVVYTQREEITRIISARRANKKEKNIYHDYYKETY
jgi:uncharacterized DUF497 family protein